MKQRLIDANEAENNLYGFTRYTGIDEAPYEYAETVISKLPTIEAIPIVYIRRVMAHWKEYESEWDGFWWEALDRLIKGWLEMEKENESKKTG